MVYLQAAAAATGQVPRDVTVQRQTQAVDNIGVIMQSLGDVGRASPLREWHCALSRPHVANAPHAVLVPLCIVTIWQQFAIQAMPSSALSIASANIEVKLAQWWAEAGRLWGLSRSVVGSGELHDFQPVHMGYAPGQGEPSSGVLAPRNGRVGTAERPRHPQQTYSVTDEPRGVPPHAAHRLTDLLNGSRDVRDPRDLRDARDSRDPRDRRRSFVELPPPPAGNASSSASGSRRASPLGRLPGLPEGSARLQASSGSSQVRRLPDAAAGEERAEERPAIGKRKSFVLDGGDGEGAQPPSSEDVTSKQSKMARAQTSTSTAQPDAHTQHRPHSVAPILSATLGHTTVRRSSSRSSSRSSPRASEAGDGAQAMQVEGEGGGCSGGPRSLGEPSCSPRSAAPAERVSPGMAALLDAVEEREKSREKS